MLCEKCGKNEATYHLKQVVNGKTTETHLCAECAAEAPEFKDLNMDSFNDFFGSFGSPWESALGSFGLLGHMLGAGSGAKTRRRQRSCPVCGATEEDIASGGMLGCANCYEVFGDMLQPYIRRLHGNVEHTGKVPSGASEELAKNRKLEKLKSDMQKAIEAQEFERAAELRDEIRGLEG